MPSRKITTHSEWYRGYIAPLYCKYDGQHEPQEAYLELDPENWSIDATYNAEIGTAVTAAVWHGRRIRVGEIPPGLSGAAVADLLEDREILALVRKVFLGYTTEWNNSNCVGVLTKPAQKALEELELALIDRCECMYETDYAQFHCVSDWISDSDLVALTRDTLKEIASRVEAEAEADGVLLEHDVEKYLRHLLEEKEEDEEDEDDEEGKR